MANYANILAEIVAAVYTNDNEEITGAALQQVLLDMVGTLGVGYQFAGVATTSTNHGTPDGKVFYLAPAGSYTNFGASAGSPHVVPEGYIGVFMWASAWTRTNVPITPGGGYLFKGVASPDTAHGTPDGKVFYLAPAGSYTNFGAPAGTPHVVPDGYIGVFMYAGSWTRTNMPITPDIVNNLTDGGADKVLSAEMGKEIGEILNGEPTQVTSTWSDWALSSANPKRAFKIAGSKAVQDGVITVKLSSYSTYKIQVSIQDSTGWTSDTVSDTGWKTEDISKTISSAEAGYYIRVGIGRVDNSAITLTEFLSAISEIKYVFISSSGLVQKVAALEAQMGSLPAYMNEVPYYELTNPQVVDLSGLVEQSGSFTGSKTWYTTSGGKHKAIPVTPGDKYVIIGDGNGFWAWLSSSYNPPYSNGAAVPYASGYQRVLQKNAQPVTVPAGAAYLAFTTVNGSGVASTWTIIKVSAYKRRYSWPVIFKYATWNIGAFKYTDWNVGDPTHVIPAEDADEYALKYRKLIDATGADILGICEYDPSYSAAAQSTKNVIFPQYVNIYEGNRTGANSNTIMFNGSAIEYVGREEITFTTNLGTRYYTHLTARIAGENVHLVCAHLDHSNNPVREAQIAQLIADMAGYKYVVIAGDFNTGDEEVIDTELAAFKTAGYTIANDGNIGLVITSLTQEYVDNIVVRGFSMSNIEANQESGTLSDHLLLSCVISMIFDL